MWFLKSPRNSTPVDAQTFFYETWQQDPYKLTALIVLYEKLSYCSQMDFSFALICYYHSLNWINMFTLSKQEYSLLKNMRSPSPMEQIVQYYKHVADIIDDKPRQYFQPELPVKDFIDLTMRRFAKATEDERENLQKEITLELWDIQKKIAGTIFAETDEYDPGGFLEIFKVVIGLVRNKVYLEDCLEAAQRNNPHGDLLPEIYNACKRIEKKLDDAKISISTTFYELSQLYDTLPEKIKQKDYHWKKLYLFAKHKDMFNLIDALLHIEYSPGKPYIIDNGNTYGWNDTYGILTGLIRKRINPDLSGKKDWEPFMLAFDKDSLWDDARKELSNKALAKIDEIDTAVNNYLGKE